MIQKPFGKLKEWRFAWVFVNSLVNDYISIVYVSLLLNLNFCKLIIKLRHRRMFQHHQNPWKNSWSVWRNNWTKGEELRGNHSLLAETLTTTDALENSDVFFFPAGSVGHKVHWCSWVVHPWKLTRDILEISPFSIGYASTHLWWIFQLISVWWLFGVKGVAFADPLKMKSCSDFTYVCHIIFCYTRWTTDEQHKNRPFEFV